MSKLQRPLFIILAIILALGVIEGIAWWWMHPAPAGLGHPVLCYRPQVGPDRRARPLVANGVDRKDQAPAIADPSPSSTDNPTSDL